MMTNEIDTDYTDEVVCPHCGHEHSDSWEYNLTEQDYGALECAECGEMFEATLNKSISYSTRKVAVK
jgi:transcription elongation factor Elf1